MKYHVLSSEMIFLIYYEVFLLFLQIQGIRGTDGDGNCVIENVTWEELRTIIDIPDSLNKNEINKEVYKKGCAEIIAIETDPKAYFDVYLDGKTHTQIIVKSNENLEHIDDKSSNSPQSVTTAVTFTCSNGKTQSAIFVAHVYDVNIHPPEFSQVKYEFTLPMPMPPNIDLSQFGEYIISAKDLDFSTTDIIFTSDLDQLACSTEYIDGSDFPYILHMSFSTYVSFVKNTTINIYATDNGVPPQTTEPIEITFIIDEEQSEYVPSFSQPSFVYKYDEEDIAIVAESKQVTIENSRDDIECKISEEFQSYFKTPTLDGSIVLLELQGKLPQDIISKNVQRVTLNCGIPTKIQGDADVLISIPEQLVLFAKYSYTAKYLINGDGHKVDMTDFITIKGNTESISIEVDEKYADYFEVKIHTEGSKQWVLTKKIDLTTELLEDANLNIIISINSPGRDFSDKAVVMVVLPNGETGVNFLNSFLIGNYIINEDGKGEVISDSKFELNSKYVKVLNKKLKGKYKDFFKINYEQPGTFAIEMSGELPEDAQALDTILLTLRIEFSLGIASQSTEATFVISMSNPIITTPHTEPTTEDTDDCDFTVWLVVTIILCLLLVLYIGASLLYYFKKMRNRNDDNEFPIQEEKMEEHYEKKMSRSTSLKDVATRRPTGFMRFNPDLEKEDDEESTDSETEKNTNANKRAAPPPPPLPQTDNIKDNAKDERTAQFQDTLSEALKKAVKERESRLI